MIDMHCLGCHHGEIFSSFILHNISLMLHMLWIKEVDIQLDVICTNYSTILYKKEISRNKKELQTGSVYITSTLPY